MLDTLAWSILIFMGALTAIGIGRVIHGFIKQGW